MPVENELSNDLSGFLNPPKVEHQVFKENYIRESIVELKFPTLIGLLDEPPKLLSEQVRKIFPNVNKITSHHFSDQGPGKSEGGYEFSCRDPKKGAFRLFESSIAFRSNNYVSFEEFFELFMTIYKASVPLIQSEFYTRVGYRTINHIPLPPNEPISDYINPVLVQPLDTPVLGRLISSLFQMRGKISESASYNFQYGVPENRLADYKKLDSDGNINFLLDYDYYMEDVDCAAAPDLLNDFHGSHFDFFWWSLGKKSIDILEKSNA